MLCHSSQKLINMKNFSVYYNNYDLKKTSVYKQSGSCLYEFSETRLNERDKFSIKNFSVDSKKFFHMFH